MTLQLFAKYGQVAEFWIFSRRVVATCDPELAKAVLTQRPELFNRSRKTGEIFKLSEAQGLFDVNGQHWSMIRKAVAPTFTKVNRVIIPTEFHKKIA